MNKISAVILGALLCAGLVVLGFSIAGGISSISDNQRTVTVRGLCEKEVPADKVTWPIVYKTVGNDMRGIYDAIEKNNALIIDFLTSDGISPDEISVNPPQVYDFQADRYGDNKNSYRYNVTSVIVVTSSQVDKVRSLIKRQAELMKQGVAVIADDYRYETTYEYTGLNDIKPEMIAEATANAREAADKFAADSHSSLGKIKTASQGQFTITDRDQYTPYIKKIRVVSSITYFLRD